MRLSVARPVEAALLLGLVLVLNPLIYAIQTSAAGIMPDSVAYLAFAERLVSEGALLLRGWAHVDSGLVLSPLYPLLVGLTGKLTGDPMLAAQFVSQLAMLASVVLIYGFVCVVVSPWFAVLTALIVQVSATYLFFGTAILTEALFILVLLLALAISWRCFLHSETRAAWWIGAGCAAGLVFLTRHVGLFFVIMQIGLLGWYEFRSTERSTSRLAVKLGLLLLGFSLFVGPYAYLLYSQTGHSPLVQSIRLGEYTVSSDQPDAVAEGSVEANIIDYESLIVERRKQRQLLPDHSEMLANVLVDNKTSGESANIVREAWRRASLDQLSQNLSANIGYLRQALGLPLLLLLGVTCATAICAEFGRKRPSVPRGLPAGIIIGYLLVVSLATGLVARYMQVLIPVAILQMSLEGHFLAQRLLPSLSLRDKRTLLSYAVILAGVVMLLPGLFTQVRLFPKPQVDAYPLSACADQLTEFDAVFALHPMHAYLVNGTYRILPNDSIEAISRYARHTGVSWLLLTNSKHDIEERRLYRNSPWLNSGANIVEQYSSLISVSCVSASGSDILFRFRDARE